MAASSGVCPCKSTPQPLVLALLMSSFFVACFFFLLRVKDHVLRAAVLDHHRQHLVLRLRQIRDRAVDEKRRNA